MATKDIQGQDHATNSTIDKTDEIPEYQNNENSYHVEVKLQDPCSRQTATPKTTSIWPQWNSNPPATLGDHVRSVFMDLCDGRTAGQLQQQFPHEWSILLGKFRLRADLRKEIMELAKQL